MSSIKLNRIETIQLINAYRNYECLWNYRCENYMRLDLKRRAWEDISKKFNSSVEDVKRKVKYLRTAYVSEKKKVQASRSNDSHYQPSLYYYKEFHYLDSAIVLRKTGANFDNSSSVDWNVKNDQVFLSDDDCTITQVENIAPAQNGKCTGVRMPVTRTFRTPNRSQNVNATFTTHSSSAQPKEDQQYIAFGNSVSAQLKVLKPITASRAMAQIQKILTEETIAELETARESNLETSVNEFIVPNNYESDSDNLRYVPETSRLLSTTRKSYARSFN